MSTNTKLAMSSLSSSSPSLLFCLSLSLCIIGLVHSFPPMGYHHYRSHYRTHDHNRLPPGPGLYGHGGGGGGSHYHRSPSPSPSYDHERNHHRGSRPGSYHHSSPDEHHYHGGDDHQNGPHRDHDQDDSGRYHHYRNHHHHHSGPNRHHQDDQASAYHRKNKMAYYGDQSMRDSIDHHSYYYHDNDNDNEEHGHIDDYGNSFHHRDNHRGNHRGNYRDHNNNNNNNKRPHNDQRHPKGQRYPIHPVTTEEPRLDLASANNNPDFYTIESQESPITILFKTSSLPLNVQQESIVNPSAPVQRLISQEPPHQLIHRVTKPIVQEIHEIIAPYRKITQEIRPVQEEFQTIVASDPSDSMNRAQQQQRGLGGQSLSSSRGSNNKNSRRLFDLAMQMNGSNPTGAFLISSLNSSRNQSQRASSLIGQSPNSNVSNSNSRQQQQQQQSDNQNNGSNGSTGSNGGGSTSEELSNSINSNPSSKA